MRALRSDVAATGALIWIASTALGVPTIGWRHERRALEIVVEAVCVRGWGVRERGGSGSSPLRISGLAPAELPDLAADAARPRAELLALGLGFWLARHAAAGARVVEFTRVDRDVVARCDRGGDPCDEVIQELFGAAGGVSGSSTPGLGRRASTRYGAWVRLSCAPHGNDATNGAAAAS